MKPRTNRRVAGVMEAFDRLLESHARDHDSMQNVMFALMSKIDVGTWPDEGLRAVVLALAMNAPTEDLEVIKDWAANELEWTEGFELVTRYRNLTGVELDRGVIDLHVLARAMRGEGKQPTVTTPAPNDSTSEVH